MSSASFVAAGRLRDAELGATHVAAPERGQSTPLELSCFPRHSDEANKLLLCLTHAELSSLLSTCRAWALHGDGAAWALSQAWDIGVPAAMSQVVFRDCGQRAFNFGAPGTCEARRLFFHELRRVRPLARVAGGFSREPVELADALQWARGRRHGRRAFALVGTDAEFFAAVAELANDGLTGVSGLAHAGSPIRVMVGPSFGSGDGVDLSAYTHGGRTPFRLCLTRSQFVSDAEGGAADSDAVCAIHPSALLDAASAAATEAALGDVPRRAVLVGVCPALARALADDSSLPHLLGVKEWARRLLSEHGPYVVFSSHCAALHPTPWVAAARGFYDVDSMLADQLVGVVGAAHFAAAEHVLDGGGAGSRPRAACCVIYVSACVGVHLSFLGL